MPNRVYNKLTVTALVPELAEFVERAQGEIDSDTGEPIPLDFEQHVPTPPELLAGVAAPVRTPASDDGWFYRRNEHWGTKWNAMWPEREGGPGDNVAVYQFATAWAPPEPWLARVSEEHRDVSFKLEFVEEFCQASGGERWQAGTLVETWPVDPERADWIKLAENESD